MLKVLVQESGHELYDIMHQTGTTMKVISANYTCRNITK